ncbi:unnamed protein product [Orchesella dallaii]|uniref:Uncharacterized protein n=1 Tax=Orchesella dallaii TaxID=48710 RepID=A0ABP1S6C8_9HEXA
MPPPPTPVANVKACVTVETSDTATTPSTGVVQAPGEKLDNLAAPGEPMEGGEKKKKKKKKKNKKGNRAGKLHRAVLAGKVPPFWKTVPRSTGKGNMAGGSPVVAGPSGIKVGYPTAQGTPPGSKRKMEDRSPQPHISPNLKRKSEIGDSYKDRLIVTRVMISQKETPDVKLDNSHRELIMGELEGFGGGPNSG